MEHMIFLTKDNKHKMRTSSFLRLSILLIYVVMTKSMDPIQQSYLNCLIYNSVPSPPISDYTYFPNNASYTNVLQSYIHNLVFSTSSTPKPLFIVAAAHVSHIQASIICCKIHGLEIRIRSGGHDYDGLSYVSHAPFIILDMFNLRAVDVNIDEETAWVESGAILGEVYYKIAEKSKIHGFPAGVCPTVGVGGHFSGAGYGSLMRKYGLTVDHVVDAKIVDTYGRLLDRKAMGEDLFWAIRGGGGASFGVVVSWKIKLVLVPEVVTVFKVQRTLEENATNIVYKWQEVAPKMHEDLFIRLVLMPSSKGQGTIKAKFVSLFLGNAKKLMALMDQRLPELGLKSEDCHEMSWVESILYWSNYPIGTSLDVLLDRHSQNEKFLKKKSDYVQEVISKEGLEGIWKKMIELKKPVLTFNPYGGKMSEIPEDATPFPHRAGNLYKIQYSVNWKEDDAEALNQNLDRIRQLYEYMTPHVSKSPRGAYLNYRDIDLGVNQNGNASYEQASIWGLKYFNDNFDRLVQVKTAVDPGNFFRYEQSIPSLVSWKDRTIQ